MIFPFASPHNATSSLNVDLILSLWKDIPPHLEGTYFDPYFLSFGVKSPKKALQNNIAQREKLVA